jgi:peptidoglycan/xylan/chitin deacetylase (PgdA/CDA1 family)
MYHSISETTENRIHPYFRINTSPAIFAGHMRFLYENKYSVIPLNTIKTKLKSDENIYNKYVSITFDDAYQDFYTYAFPILREFGFSATVFLPTGFIDNKETSLKESKEHLTWNEIQELDRKGIDFGSHTVKHPQLKFLNPGAIEYEIEQSKETIEDKLNKSVDSFSYPFAFPEEDKQFTEYLRKTLHKHNYTCGVTTKIGTASLKDDRYFLRRIPINSCDETVFFKAKLEGAYNWLGKFQFAYKLVKSKISKGYSAE